MPPYYDLHPYDAMLEDRYGFQDWVPPWHGSCCPSCWEQSASLPNEDEWRQAFPDLPWGDES